MFKVLLLIVAIRLVIEQNKLDAASSRPIRIPLNGREECSSSEGSKNVKQNSEPICLPLNNVCNWLYYGQIKIGNPPQKFSMMFDTGSPIIWVPALHLDNMEKKKRMFYNLASSTFKPIDAQCTITYLDGDKMSGQWGIDDVWIVDNGVHDQYFVRMTQVKSPYNQYDGIVGMSLEIVGNRSNLLQNMFNQNLIPDLIFSVYLTRDINQRTGSEIVFGGINTNRLIGDITYTNILPGVNWRITLDGIALQSSDKTTMMRFCENGCEAMIDTGNSRIDGPSADVIKIAEFVGAEFSSKYCFYQLPCLNTNFPDLVFTIEGREFVLGPDQYISLEYRDDVQVCRLDILTLESDYWILGGNFIGTYYTIFDAGRRRIGFALANHIDPSKELVDQ